MQIVKTHLEDLIVHVKKDIQEMDIIVLVILDLFPFFLSRKSFVI